MFPEKISQHKTQGGKQLGNLQATASFSTSLVEVLLNPLEASNDLGQLVREKKKDRIAEELKLEFRDSIA